MHYLAYGSNMLSARLRSRVPSARSPRVVTLPGRAVLYRKLSRKDQSAKCDLAVTANPFGAAYGVVFDIDPTEQAALDCAEGRGYGYHVETLEVVIGGRATEAVAYIADEDAVVDDLPPHDWYRDLVVAGAKEHGLPADYVELLDRVEVSIDPDSARAARERSVIPPQWCA